MTMPMQTPAELRLFDQMPAGLAVYDIAGRLVHANPHFRRLVSSDGLPSKSRGASGRWQGYGEDGRELAVGSFPCERALQGEIVVPGIDLLHCADDGVGKWLKVSASPIYDPVADAIVGAVLLFVDSHNRTEADFAATTRSHFELFAEHSGNAIWIADAATGRYQYRNPEHAAIAGTGRRDIECLAGWLSHVGEDDRRSVRHSYDRARGGETSHFEYQMPGAHGGVCKIHETSFPIRDDSGAIIMLGGILEDITPECGDMVYLVTGRPDTNRMMTTLFERRFKSVKAFGSVRELLDVANVLSRGCVVVDLASLDEADSDLSRSLTTQAARLPLVVIGRAETPAATAIATMRCGAADYLIPPYDGEALLAAVLRAIARTADLAAQPAASDERLSRLARLSKREREVLAGLSGGGTNKSIARDLGISPRTVELHRSHLMERMNVHSLAELFRAAYSFSPGDPNGDR